MRILFVFLILFKAFENQGFSQENNSCQPKGQFSDIKQISTHLENSHNNPPHPVICDPSENDFSKLNLHLDSFEKDAKSLERFIVESIYGKGTTKKFQDALLLMQKCLKYEFQPDQCPDHTQNKFIGKLKQVSRNEGKSNFKQIFSDLKEMKIPQSVLTSPAMVALDLPFQFSYTKAMQDHKIETLREKIYRFEILVREEQKFYYKESFRIDHLDFSSFENRDGVTLSQDDIFRKDVGTRLDKLLKTIHQKCSSDPNIEAKFLNGYKKIFSPAFPDDFIQESKKRLAEILADPESRAGRPFIKTISEENNLLYDTFRKIQEDLAYANNRGEKVLKEIVNSNDFKLWIKELGQDLNLDQNDLDYFTSGNSEQNFLSDLERIERIKDGIRNKVLNRVKGEIDNPTVKKLFQEMALDDNISNLSRHLRNYNQGLMNKAIDLLKKNLNWKSLATKGLIKLGPDMLLGIASERSGESPTENLQCSYGGDEILNKLEVNKCQAIRSFTQERLMEIQNHPSHKNNIRCKPFTYLCSYLIKNCMPYSFPRQEKYKTMHDAFFGSTYSGQWSDQNERYRFTKSVSYLLDTIKEMNRVNQ